MARPVRRPPPPKSTPPAHAGSGGKGHAPSPPHRPRGRHHDDEDEDEDSHKKPPPRRRHIAKPPAALMGGALVLALAGAWAGLWFHAANSLRERVLTQLDGLRAAGWTVSHGEAKRTGFPLRAMLRLPALHLEAPTQAGAPSGGMVEAASLTLSLLPWDLDALTLDAAAPLAVRAPTWLGGWGLEASGGTVQGRVEGDAAGRLAHLALTVQSLDGRIAAGPLSLSSLALTLDAHDIRPPVALKDTVFALSLEMRGIQVPDPRATAPGPRLDLATVQARVLGPVDRDQSLTQAAQRWSNDGGTVELDSLRLLWPPLSVSAAGTLALDKDMQPVAALSSQVAGLFPLLERMEAAGSVRPRDASVARVVLGTLARRDEAGELVLTLPLTVQSHALSVGPARLVDLPPVAWPAAPPAAQVPEASNATPPPASYTVDRWGNVIPKD